MTKVAPLGALFGVLAVLAGCSSVSMHTSAPPADFERVEDAVQAPLEGPIEVVVVDPSTLPAPEKRDIERRDDRSRLEGPLDEEEIERLQSLARNQVARPDLARQQDPSLRAPVPGIGFDHLDFVTSGQNWVPPDPELAVGPNRMISVVNDAMYITDHLGTMIVPAISLPAFFASVTGCSNLFDPNVLYDEQLDRFVVGMDANGTGYCVAMSQTGDPTQPWNAYSFGTVTAPPTGSPNFFDYPHAGVGDVAIYMGGNIYDPTGTTFQAAVVWAIDKLAMASGSALPMPAAQVVTSGFTPQPMNAHGWLQGTWPSGQPHFILANQYHPAYSPDLLDVWQWTDPLGANSFINAGSVDLSSVAGGILGGYPVPAPQNGGSTIEGNDWRILDNEYRNARLWVSQNISCNPGGGTVDCVRWAEIDPAVPSVVQAGVLATDGEYRVFPDLAVNHCDDMTIGYTKSSSSTSPEVWASGRFGLDPAGMLAQEFPVHSSTTTYVSWETTPPRRWGDYTGATTAPDGITNWYLGEYSKNFSLPTAYANWGTWVNEFMSDCGADLRSSIDDGTAQVVPGASLTYTMTVTNGGRGESLGALISDVFPAVLHGVQWTCSDQGGPPTSVCGAPSGTGHINLAVDLESGSAVTLTATGVVDPAATGSLTNSIIAASPRIRDVNSTNDTATDVDTLTPQADLVVGVDNKSSYVLPSGTTTYTVTVANNGLSDAQTPTVADTVDSQLTVTSWTCVDDGTSACGSSSGTGPLADSPVLPAASSVSYQVSCQVGAAASGQVSYTVSVQPATGVGDPNAADNSSTDVDPVGVEIFKDGFEFGDTDNWSDSVP